MSTVRSGDVIGRRYRLDEAIGEGGMGVVWRATDLELRRVVAVKRALTGDGEVTRREARIGAGLQHAGVVAVFDVVEDGDQRWLVMEYLPSRTVAQMVETDGPLDPQVAARIGAQVAAALHAMHAKGMVHRDIKPSNILVAKDGTAKLTDLGVAQWNDVTRSGEAEMVGTPGYIAPEVAAGGIASGAANMYSLGATLRVAIGDAPGTRLGDVLKALLDPDPARRPTPAEAERLLLDATGRRTRRRLMVGGALLLTVGAIATIILVAKPFSNDVVDFVGDPRTADPCGLLDAQRLAHWGPTKVDSDYGEYNRCDVLVDTAGNSVNVAVSLETGPDGDTGVTPSAPTGRETLVDRPVQDGDECVRRVIPPAPYWVMITARYREARPDSTTCPMADALTEGVLARIGDGTLLPTRAPFDNRSLAHVDACDLLRSDDLTEVVGSGAAAPFAGFGNWSCLWKAPTGKPRVLIEYDRSDPIPPDEGVPVRLEDRDAIVMAENWGKDNCVVAVAYRPYRSPDQGEDKVEYVHLSLRAERTSEQRCATARTLATAIANKLPR